MNNSYKPTLCILLIFMGTLSSATAIYAILHVPVSSETEPTTLPVPSGFYDDIGYIYDALTDDGLQIKVLRYRAPGKGFNYGSQPVLLFPGLCCNINQFMPYSTPEMKELFNIELPTNLADWAVGDENIKKDPLLYYSLAYSLWKRGYDPWFANYRGVGMGEMRSEDGDKSTSLDDFAIYDVRAAVKKVNEITNLHPAIGGHSTGGLTSLMYLQGVQYNSDGHVQSYSFLEDERNGDIIGSETVEGFIGLDPAWIPGMTTLLDNFLVWALLDLDLIVDLRDIMDFTLGIPGIDDLIALILGYVTGDLGELLTDMMFNYANLDVSNVEDWYLYYFSAYAVDKLYTRTIAQYFDFVARDTVRECFKNGLLNEDLSKPPSPEDDDGYYYYIDNTDKIKVPAITCLATMEEHGFDLVDGEKVIKYVVNGKTYNALDELHWIEGAHIDMPGGIRAPIELYPTIGNWLVKI